ncbi:hypothetical protein BJ912DRAFT_1060731 [Pholiota molesta]|nr:hypothetical protein BJ912DRAFT_1060731 [Pholiota molesta]
MTDIAEQPPPQRSRTWFFYAILVIAVLPVGSPFPCLGALPSIPFIRNGGPRIRAVGCRILVSCCEVASSSVFIMVPRASSLGLSSICNWRAERYSDSIQSSAESRAPRKRLPSEGGDLETLPLDDRPESLAEPSPSSTATTRAPSTPSHGEMAVLDDVQRAAPPLDQISPSAEALWIRLGALAEADRTSLISCGGRSLFTAGQLGKLVRNNLYMKLFDMRRGHSNGIEYLFRTPAEWNPNTSPRPIIFIHGSGSGSRTAHQPGVLPPAVPAPAEPARHRGPAGGAAEGPGVGEAGREGAGVGAVGVQGGEEEEEEDAFVEVPQRGVTMISHSNGSYTHAWMLKGHPELIGRSCFIDPVTFVHGKGMCAIISSIAHGMEMLIRYYVATELGVANLLQRHSAGRRTRCGSRRSRMRETHTDAVCPGGKDDIRVKLYLTSHGVRKNLWCDPTGRHGQALVPGRRR